MNIYVYICTHRSKVFTITLQALEKKNLVLFAQQKNVKPST